MKVPTANVVHEGEQITVRIAEQDERCHIYYFRDGEESPFQSQSVANMSLARIGANDLFKLTESDWKYEDWTPAFERSMMAPTAKGIRDGVEITVWIEKQEEGFYVFYFKEAEQSPFRDELQPSFEIAKQSAEEFCGIVISSWKEEPWVPLIAP